MKIFYIIGKSASGKDHIFAALKGDAKLNLSELILYTTRPMRAGEIDGETYHFVDESRLIELRREGRVIEERTYDTVYGPWTYATVDEDIAGILCEASRLLRDGPRCTSLHRGER